MTFCAIWLVLVPSKLYLDFYISSKIFVFNFQICCHCLFSDPEHVIKGIEDEEEVPSSNTEDKLKIEWEKYWNDNGPALIWNSWVEKYKEFINPEYLKTESQLSEEQSSVASGPPDSDWSKIWEDHQQEQHLYYHNWFSQWWVNQSSIAAESPSESNTTTHSRVDENQHAISQASLDLEGLSINPEMDDNLDLSPPKEQRDKSVLEKTKDYLKELGFTTTINQPSSCVTDCKIETKKKKKKRPKKHRIIPGPVLNDPASLVSKFHIFKAVCSFSLFFK